MACISAQPESGLPADHHPQNPAAGKVRGMDMATLLIFAGPQMCVSESQMESEGTALLFGEHRGNVARCARFGDGSCTMLWLYLKASAALRPGEEVGKGPPKLPPNPQRVLN